MFKKRYKSEVIPTNSDKIENTPDGLLTIKEYKGEKEGPDGSGLEIYTFMLENSFPIGKRSVYNVEKPLRVYTRRGLDTYFEKIKNRK